MTALTALALGYSVNNGRVGGSDREVSPTLLDSDRLPDHIDAPYRATCALCGSRHDAEDLVQETFARVLKRPQALRSRQATITTRLHRGRQHVVRALGGELAVGPSRWS